MNTERLCCAALTVFQRLQLLYLCVHIDSFHFQHHLCFTAISISQWYSLWRELVHLLARTGTVLQARIGTLYFTAYNFLGNTLQLSLSYHVITLHFIGIFSEFRYIFLIIVMYFVILLCRGKLMLYRKAYDYMLNWKSSKDKKALLITGARQTGKTYIVRKFGKKNY